MLEVLALVGSVLLALVFAGAGWAKVADRTGTRATLSAFGLPAPLVPLSAVLLPLAELGVAVLLLVPSTRVTGAVGALGLLGVFSAAVSASLARGRAPECHCFGQVHSAPVSAWTLGRNVALAALGVVALSAGTFAASPGELAGAAAALLVIVAGAALLRGGLALMRAHGRLLLRVDAVERALALAGLDLDLDLGPAAVPAGLVPGTAAPAFALVSAGGGTVTLDALLAPGRPVLLAFTSPSCGPCRILLPRLAAWQSAHAQDLGFAVLTDGDRAVAVAEVAEHGLEHVLLDPESAIYARYEASGTPSAVVVAADGTIASRVAAGAEAIEALVLETVRDAAEDGLAVGALAPALELTGLDGEPVVVGGAAEPTLLLFWNPACGFCSSMRDALRAWEADPPAGAPRLVVLSSGGASATRADAFASPVALDPDMAAGAALGATGTPMAVLLDRDGRIASPLAGGADAVLALAGARDPLAMQLVR